MGETETYKFIFEGSELAGKTTLVSALYRFLSYTNAPQSFVLDSCISLYCDIGLFSTPEARQYLYYMSKIVELLKRKNIVIDKFHISDIVYTKLYVHKDVAYRDLEKTLLFPLSTKIILVTLPPGDFEQRLHKRLKTNPLYQRIARPIEFYVHMQELYIQYVNASSLDHLIINGADTLSTNLALILSSFSIASDAGLIEKIANEMKNDLL